VIVCFVDIGGIADYQSRLSSKEKHSVLTSRENINTKANYQLRRSCQWSSTVIFSISIQPLKKTKNFIAKITLSSYKNIS